MCWRRSTWVHVKPNAHPGGPRLQRRRACAHARTHPREHMSYSHTRKTGINPQILLNWAHVCVNVSTKIWTLLGGVMYPQLLHPRKSSLSFYHSFLFCWTLILWWLSVLLLIRSLLYLNIQYHKFPCTTLCDLMNSLLPQDTGVCTWLVYL